jgi:OmpA family protein
MNVKKAMLAVILISFVPIKSFSDSPGLHIEPNNTIKHPLYAGLTVGYGTTTWNGLLAPSDETFVMAVSTPTNVNEGGTIGGAFIGYEIFPSFALELSYTHYPNAKLYFDEYSLITYQYDGIMSVVTHTNNYSVVGKFIVPVPHTHNIRIFSSVGPSVTHRQDTIYDHWQLTPAFNLGFDIDITEHIMTEVGANYTAGTAISELDPAEDYIPFLYSGFARFAWRF